MKKIHVLTISTLCISLFSCSTASTTSNMQAEPTGVEMAAAFVKNKEPKNHKKNLGKILELTNSLKKSNTYGMNWPGFTETELYVNLGNLVEQGCIKGANFEIPAEGGVNLKHAMYYYLEAARRGNLLGKNNLASLIISDRNPADEKIEARDKCVFTLLNEVISAPETPENAQAKRLSLFNRLRCRAIQGALDEAEEDLKSLRLFEDFDPNAICTSICTLVDAYFGRLLTKKSNEAYEKRALELVTENSQRKCTHCKVTLYVLRRSKTDKVISEEQSALLKELINSTDWSNLHIEILQEYARICEPKERHAILEHIHQLPVPETGPERERYFFNELELISVLLYDIGANRDIERAFALSTKLFNESKTDDPFFRKKATVYIATYFLQKKECKEMCKIIHEVFPPKESRQTKLPEYTMIADGQLHFYLGQLYLHISSFKDLDKAIEHLCKAYFMECPSIKLATAFMLNNEYGKARKIAEDLMTNEKYKHEDEELSAATYLIACDIFEGVEKSTFLNTIESLRNKYDDLDEIFVALQSSFIFDSEHQKYLDCLIKEWGIKNVEKSSSAPTSEMQDEVLELASPFCSNPSGFSPLMRFPESNKKTKWLGNRNRVGSTSIKKRESIEEIRSRSNSAKVEHALLLATKVEKEILNEKIRLINALAGKKGGLDALEKTLLEFYPKEIKRVTLNGSTVHIELSNGKQITSHIAHKRSAKITFEGDLAKEIVEYREERKKIEERLKSMMKKKK